MSFKSTTRSHSVLVVGGAGFVGSHLVSYFIKHGIFREVAVLSRNAASSLNRVDKAAYYTGDLTNHKEINDIVHRLKPSVIIHSATPSVVRGTSKEYNEVNIQGTSNLLEVAKESDHVQALIYTSSSTLAEGFEHLNLDESTPLADTDPKASPYAKSKAVAETIILQSNSPRLQHEAGTWAGHLSTVALRFPIVYGTGNNAAIEGCLNVLAKGQTNFILGDGDNLWSFCSTDKAAISHAMVAAALLSPPHSDPTQRIDGEAFNIHDGRPYPFWGFARLCWKHAGYDPRPPPKVIKLPTWLALSIATILEWAYWIFTFGTKRPYNLGKQQVEYSCFTHTYSIEKANVRLGFKPQVDFEAEIKACLDWFLEEGGWRNKLKDLAWMQKAGGK